MNFDNYGTYWWVDHIIPCRAFDLEIEEHQKVCFNYRNCRPMEKIENIVKGNTVDKKWEKIINLEVIKKQIFGVS